MSVLEDARKAIITKISNEFTDIDIAYENVSYKENPSTTFIRPIINYGDGFDIGLSDYNYIVGILTVFIFTPKNTGKKINNDIGDRVRALFNKAQDKNIVYAIPSYPSVVIDDNFYCQKIKIRLEVYETASKQFL